MVLQKYINNFNKFDNLLEKENIEQIVLFDNSPINIKLKKNKKINNKPIFIKGIRDYYNFYKININDHINIEKYNLNKIITILKKSENKIWKEEKIYKKIIKSKNIKYGDLIKKSMLKEPELKGMKQKLLNPVLINNLPNLIKLKTKTKLSFIPLSVNKVATKSPISSKKVPVPAKTFPSSPGLKTAQPISKPLPPPLPPSTFKPSSPVPKSPVPGPKSPLPGSKSPGFKPVAPGPKPVAPGPKPTYPILPGPTTYYEFTNNILKPEYIQESRKVEEKKYTSYLKSYYHIPKWRNKYFILMFGSPCSGKSSALRKGLNILKHIEGEKLFEERNFIKVDPDQLRYYNPNFREAINGVTFNKENKKKNPTNQINLKKQNGYHLIKI